MRPPLARTVWPLTQWPAGLTRNAATSAMSALAQMAVPPAEVMVSTTSVARPELPA